MEFSVNPHLNVCLMLEILFMTNNSIKFRQKAMIFRLLHAKLCHRTGMWTKINFGNTAP